VPGQTARTFGHTGPPSLWDAPGGCASYNPVARPEGVARLVLGTTAPTLTVSTFNPGTDFDTTLYLLRGCPATSAANLACRDDVTVNNVTISVASRLVLTNVASGTYMVVVDSLKPGGGNYELTATVE
jgi:hypothetical protein